MVLQPLYALWQAIKATKPAFLRKKPHFSFITVHYFWIVGLVILGSILMYIPRNIAYVDALFFASGGCTQSGLNTVDVNLLTTYQQIVIFFLPQLTNPITINTFVVFLRLYWFEKRFQHIAKEAKRQRKTISRTRSEMWGERDIGKEERGVRGRTITVMHNTAVNAGRTPNGSVPRIGGKDFARGERSESFDKHANGHANGNGKERKNSADDDYAITFEREDSMAQKPVLKSHATIKFSDQVKRSDGLDDETLRMPARRDNDAHIAFLERQRKRDDGVLRIPGPRDADRGIAPETIEEDDPNSPLQKRTSNLVPDGNGGLMIDPRQADVEAANASKKEKLVESARAAAGAMDLLGFLRPKNETVPDGENGTMETNGSSEPNPGLKKRTMSFATIKHHFTRDKEPMDPMPYISFQPTVGRNSAFVDLTEAQREELGGIEYRSLKSLAMVLIGYFWFFTFFSYISLVPWIERSGTYGEVVDEVDVNRTWWAFFSGTSAFNDVGFTLTPDSMVSFNTAVWPLLLMSFLILFGNTAFPIMLRWVIYMFSKLVPRRSGIWEELRFLLDHPRRCFTLLFPSQATWWLFWILALLNGVDLLFFIILDFNNPVVTDLKPNIRVLDGWFQATATRTAGFSVVNLAELHPAVQISYMVMMYISVFPIAISVRRTNVYEEQSLGIWSGADDEDDQHTSYVGSHIRRQLSFDLWFVALAWFIIAIAEGGPIQAPDKPAFNLFSVLFEIISAYGTVGLSMGYPDTNASFSAQFGVIGKLVIIALQIRGRHRGLPYELDRAILLPSETLHQRELQEEAKRARRNSQATMMTGADLSHITSRGSERSRKSSIDNQNPNNNFSEKEEGNGTSSGTNYGAVGGKRREKSTGNFLSSMLHPGPPAVRRYSSIRKNTDDSQSLEQRYHDAEFGTGRRPTFNGDEEFGGSSAMPGRWGGSGGGNFSRRRGSGLDAGGPSSGPLSGPMGRGTPGTAEEGEILGIRRSKTSIPQPVSRNISRRVSRAARGTDDIGNEDPRVDPRAGEDDGSDVSPTNTRTSRSGTVEVEESTGAQTFRSKGLQKVMSI